MTRNFRIPLGLAAISLTGCPEPIPPASLEPVPEPFSFVDTWDINQIVNTYSDGSTYTQTFPYVYDDETQTVAMTFGETTMSLTSTYTYTNGDPPDLYTQGPYPWSEESEGRIQITGVEDVFSFTCDEVTDNEIGCDLDYGGGTTATLTATRQP